MKSLKIESITDSNPKTLHHRFGSHKETHETVLAVLFLFKPKTSREDTVEFRIHFDDIYRTLPSLFSFPSLRAMRENIIFEHMGMGAKS